jgi:hypothetical protein
MPNDPNYQAALDFANKYRKREGLEPLSELPRGEIDKVSRCPLARALPGDAYVDGCAAQLEGEAADYIDLPPAVQRFVERFDAEEYPYLIEELSEDA